MPIPAQRRGVTLRVFSVRPSGFTLIELLVVITILGILSAVSLLILNNATKQARDGVRKSELKKLVDALELYKLEHGGQYPPDPTIYSETHYNSQSGTNWIPEMVPDYIRIIPKDPKQASLIETQGQVAAETAVTIGASYDGYVNSSGGCSSNDTGTTINVENNLRAYIKFSLTSIPQGVTITNVVFQYNVLVAPTNQSSLQAYATTGQQDPQANTCQAKRSATVGDTTPYIADGDIVGSTGIKNLTLNAEARSDLQAANDAVDGFSLAINPGSASSATAAQIESIENAAANDAKLIVTYATPDPPIVTTSAATSITDTSAALNGSANPNGGSTSGWFRWGPSNAACSSLPNIETSQSLGSGTTAVNYSQNITGLSPNTTYYFCAVAQNSAGTGMGSVLSFTTAEAPPPPPSEPPPSEPPPSTPAPTQFYYGYIVSNDRTAYVLWATLEFAQDKEIYTKSTAKCKSTDLEAWQLPPAGTPYNFCIKSTI